MREIIPVVVTRLVAEEGAIKAFVLFEIKAIEQIKRAEKAMAIDSQKVNQLLGGASFVSIGGGRTRNNTKSTLSISSVKSEADAYLTANLSGSVKIVFKPDYFKLDNLAGSMALAPARRATMRRFLEV